MTGRKSRDPSSRLPRQFGDKETTGLPQDPLDAGAWFTR